MNELVTATIAITINKGVKYCKYAAHGFIGEASSTPFTARTGFAFTNYGYLSRNDAKLLTKLKLVMDKASSSETSTPEVLGEMSTLHTNLEEKYGLPIADIDTVPTLVKPLLLSDLIGNFEYDKNKSTMSDFVTYVIKEFLGDRKVDAIEIISPLRAISKLYATKETAEGGNNKKFTALSEALGQGNTLIHIQSHHLNKSALNDLNIALRMAHEVSMYRSAKEDGSNAIDRHDIENSKGATYTNYWKSPALRNPLYSGKYNVFQSTGLHNCYYFFSTGPTGSIYDLGKRIADVTYSVVIPTDRDHYLESVQVDNMSDLLEPCNFYINCGNLWKNSVSSAVHRWGQDALKCIGAFGEIPMKSKHNDTIEIYGAYTPVGLSIRGISFLSMLEKILVRYLEKNLTDIEDPIVLKNLEESGTASISTIKIDDLTSLFFECPDGNVDAKNKKVKETIGLDHVKTKKSKKRKPTALDPIVRLPIAGGSTTTFFELGVDLIPYNNLKRLKGVQRVKSFTVSSSKNMVRYGFIIESDEGVAIYSNFESNIRFKS